VKISVNNNNKQKTKQMSETYKGKTAKEWFKLHEVMRKDFKRVLAEKQKIKAAAELFFTAK